LPPFGRKSPCLIAELTDIRRVELAPWPSTSPTAGPIAPRAISIAAAERAILRAPALLPALPALAGLSILPLLACLSLLA
jgi:hypothetical protein